MRDAAGIYVKVLPAWYLRAVASRYRQCVETMASASIPASLADDWLIVTQHLANGSDAMTQRLGASGEWTRDQTGALHRIDDREPAVVRFDRLAALTTSQGARRLETAALSVQAHIGNGTAASLSAEQRRLLQAVASGAPVADLAADLGYSQRTMYRELSRLWKALGVLDRMQAIRKAASEGLLD